jgi:hypothetical protein
LNRYALRENDMDEDRAPNVGGKPVEPPRQPGRDEVGYGSEQERDLDSRTLRRHREDASREGSRPSRG